MGRSTEKGMEDGADGGCLGGDDGGRRWRIKEGGKNIFNFRKDILVFFNSLLVKLKLK